MIGTIHIVPRGGLWGVVREGDDGEIVSYCSHHDAVQFAYELAGREHAELVFHEPDTWSLPERPTDWWSG
jgi:Uncharacterized protein conserved in bacteria (DUF2188)